MGKIKALSESEIQEHMRKAEFWKRVGAKKEEIQRQWAFPGFKDSISFVNRVAEAANSADHHPDILIQYNKVTLTMTTHDAGGLSERDFNLAKLCDEFGSSC